MGEAKRRRLAMTNQQTPAAGSTEMANLIADLARTWDPDEQWNLLMMLRAAHAGHIAIQDLLDRAEADCARKSGTDMKVVRFDFGQGAALDPKQKALYDELVDVLGEPETWPNYSRALRGACSSGWSLARMADDLQSAFHVAWKNRIALFTEHDLESRAKLAEEDYRAFCIAEGSVVPDVEAERVMNAA